MTSHSAAFALAEQVIGGCEVGQRPSRDRHQKRHVDDAIGAVARAIEDLHLGRDERRVGRIVPLGIQVPATIEVVLFQVGQEEDEAAEAAHGEVVGALDRVAGWEGAVGIVMQVQGETDLLQVVGTANATGGLADLLNGGQQADR